MLDFMLLFSKIFNTFSIVKIILNQTFCSWEKSQETETTVLDLQTICYTNYLDGSNSIRQELCVLFQHYYSIPKRKMRPTAGHKLCQTLNTNLHPSVFPIMSRRAISRTVVLVLACDCQKHSRKLPARQRLWECLSGGCRCDGQCWTRPLWQWSTQWIRESGKHFLLVEWVTLHPACLNQKPNPSLCFTISLHFAARNQPGCSKGCSKVRLSFLDICITTEK